MSDCLPSDLASALYAVSIVKAGMRAVGHPAGPVRPPLTDLRQHEFAELRMLISKISN